jgi:hypothetical protein
MRSHGKPAVTASGVTSRVLGGLTRRRWSRVACLRPGAWNLENGVGLGRLCADGVRTSAARLPPADRAATPDGGRVAPARLVIGTLNGNKQWQGLQPCCPVLEV